MMRQKEYPIWNVDEIPFREISDSGALIKSPLVSVKMVTFNHARYIAQAIEGVLKQQTNFPFELVIGEDCSTDGTREIVFDYQKKHPNIMRVITSDKNVGSRKNGLRIERACRGKYIAFCEGDDYWHDPKKLQKQVGYMEAHPEIGLVHSAFDILSSRRHGKKTKVDNGIHIRYVLENQKNIFLEMMLGKYTIATASVCVRKDLLFSVINSDPEVYQSSRFLLGDLSRWLDLSRRTQFYYCDESLCTYRLMDESMSRSKDPEKVKRFNLSVIDLRLYYLDKYSRVISKTERTQILKHLAMYSLRSGFVLNDYEMVQMGKDISPGLGIKGLCFYYAVTNKYIRIPFLPIQYIKNKRLLSKPKFLNLKN